MKASFTIKIIVCILLCLGGLSLHTSNAQTSGSESFDVFIPIGKYFSQGDAEKLSAWFSDNIEISIFENTSSASKAQARQILKYFFTFHSPRSFTFTHKAEKGSMKYALGSFSAGGEQLSVTFFASEKKGSYQIQQLKIERAR